MQHKKRILIPAVVAAAVVAAGAVLCGGNSPVLIAKALLGGTPVSSLEVKQENIPDSGLPRDDFGDRVYKYTVVADGKTYYPLVTYKDPQKAMDTLLAMPGEEAFTQKVAKTLNEPGLNAQNWKKFAQATKPFGTCPDEFDGTQAYDQYSRVQAFFDIYENDSQNQKVLDYLKAAKHLQSLGFSRVALSPIASEIAEQKNV
jgi:hypothetical protein